MAKIIHLLQGLKVGGMERGTLGQARFFQQRGHEVHLALFDSPYEGTSGELDPGSLRVHFVRRKPGIDLTFVVRLAARLRNWRADLLHARNDTALFYAALAIRLLGNPPKLAVTFHSFPTAHTRWAKMANRWAVRKCAYGNVVSSELGTRLQRTGWLDHSLPTIINGVDTADFSHVGPAFPLSEHFGLPSWTIWIGVLARMDPCKRHEDVLDAFRILRTTHPDCGLVLIGTGPLLHEVMQMATDTPRVFFLPVSSNVASVLRALDAVVLASESEGTPRALLEAMACGKPVLATSVGGIPSLLPPAEWPEWLVVPPRSPQLLARGLERLLQSRELRSQLGEVARRRVHTHFTADAEWSQYADAYERVLAPQRSA